MAKFIIRSLFFLSLSLVFKEFLFMRVGCIHGPPVLSKDGAAEKDEEIEELWERSIQVWKVNHLPIGVRHCLHLVTLSSLQLIPGSHGGFFCYFPA